MSVTVGLSTREPTPERADFAIFVDFDRDTPRPQRVFQAIEGLITAFETLDKALAESIDPSIEPVLLLEDIEGGSIKVWLRDKLLQTEDQSLYELDWRPAVGKYLVAAKYAFVEWVNDEEERSRPGALRDLKARFLELAKQTDVKRLPSYGVPNTAEILGAAKQTGTALALLDHKDVAQFVSEEGSKSFELRQAWADLDLSSLAIRETMRSGPSPMILAVKRPDYLGAAQWEFRHGTRPIRAKIDDTEWLSRFQGRQVDVRPGDALRCLVIVEVSYGFDNEVVSESYTVTKGRTGS